MIAEVNPVIDYSVRDLCRCPYPGHKNGCPNYGQRDICPPAAPLFDRIVDLSRPVYAIVNEFQLGAFAALMKAKHSGWSDKKCRCSRYWQATARKQLRLQVNEFLRHRPGYVAYFVPEAMGVHVTATLQQVGITLWPLRDIDRHVALAGVPKAQEPERCIGLSVCGGPCNESCPVVRQRKEKDGE